MDQQQNGNIVANCACGWGLDADLASPDQDAYCVRCGALIWKADLDPDGVIKAYEDERIADGHSTSWEIVPVGVRIEGYETGAPAWPDHPEWGGEVLVRYVCADACGRERTDTHTHLALYGPAKQDDRRLVLYAD